MLFLDNEASKFALLKGSSDNPVVDLLAGIFAEKESAIHSFTWLARVPSKSNIADPNDLTVAVFQNATDVSAVAEPLLEQLLTKLEEVGENGFVFSHLGKDCSAATLSRTGLQNNVHFT